MICDCLVCVKIAGIKARRKASQQTSVICFLSRLFFEILFIQTKYNTHLLSSIIGVNNFHPLNYCYCSGYFSCCYCGCFVLCFPFCFQFIFASYTNHQSTPQLYCYKPLTHQTYCLLICATVCNSALTNACISN